MSFTAVVRAASAQYSVVLVVVCLPELSAVAAVVAQLRFGQQLADVDPLHGGAEAFLTLSNALVMLGFLAARPKS